MSLLPPSFLQSFVCGAEKGRPLKRGVCVYLFDIVFIINFSSTKDQIHRIVILYFIAVNNQSQNQFIQVDGDFIKT